MDDDKGKQNQTRKAYYLQHLKRVVSMIDAKRTSDGAGVALNRAFTYFTDNRIDPFLMLDNFNSSNPEEFMAGFPWHPHRGIETVTYVLEGKVEHEDSTGSKGMINNGGIQWMTAGSGIIHQEMPKKENRKMNGFQLWVNLPSNHKMTQPRYRDAISSEIPVVMADDGTKTKIISGKVKNQDGPINDLKTDTQFMDITVPEESSLEFYVKPGYTSLIYIFEGYALFGPEKIRAETGKTVVFDREGENIILATGASPARFLLLTGKPLNEPVVWYGPIVMNTESELNHAFREYREGTFLKHGLPDWK